MNGVASLTEFYNMESTSNKIIEYIKEKGEASPIELSRYLEISNRAVFKQLSNLIQKGVIEKRGTPPQVIYIIRKEGTVVEKDNEIDKKTLELLNKNFLVITPKGEMLKGIEGFTYWSTRHKLPLEKTVKEYKDTLKKYSKYSKDGLINGIAKMKSTFNNVYLDELYYIDFYSIERFGKTSLGTLLLYAKQSQNKKLIKQVSDIITPVIKKLIKEKDIGAIGFVPPTIPREIQFMKEIERFLNINLPKIKIIKIVSGIPVAQKTLNKLEDRIENAKETIFIKEEGLYKNLLIIDDAVGSGATLNETAKKLKEKNFVKGKVIGLAITGSFKGFDVINEV